jgi:formylglycine-generating enzyme required for sulfatase activity
MKEKKKQLKSGVFFLIFFSTMIWLSDVSSPLLVSAQDNCEEAVLEERQKYDPDGDGKVGLEVAIHALQIVAGIREFEPPDMPDSINISIDDSEVTLSWNAVEGDVSYTIYWKTDNMTTWEKIENITETSYVHTGLTNGTSYSYEIVAVNSVGESERSTEIIGIPNIIPDIPTGVKATAAVGQITISWNAVQTASSYNLYWNTTGNVSGSAQQIPVTSTSYNHTGLTTGVTYYYRVTAVNSAGESQMTAQISETPVGSQTFTNKLGMEFKLIPAGTFTMGSPTTELGRDEDEIQHSVTLTKSFYIQTTEVTQEQWYAVMGDNPSWFSGSGGSAKEGYPVEKVTWDMVQGFITQMNKRKDGVYRLPTEAEWEYAARAGSSTGFANGEITGKVTDTKLNEMGWYYVNSKNETHQVAFKQPNVWGLYDMHGNVMEWCQDFYGSYATSAATNPNGPTSGSERVLRGGGFKSMAEDCRSAKRDKKTPATRENYVGFRLVVTPP